MEEGLMDVQALSERLGVPRWRVYHLNAQGLLPVVRLGKRLMFDRVQIEQFVAQGGRAFVHAGVE